MPRNPLVFGLVFGNLNPGGLWGVSTKSGFVTYTWCFDVGFTGVGSMFLGGNVSQPGLAKFCFFYFWLRRTRKENSLKNRWSEWRFQYVSPAKIGFQSQDLQDDIAKEPVFHQEVTEVKK